MFEERTDRGTIQNLSEQNYQDSKVETWDEIEKFLKQKKKDLNSLNREIKNLSQLLKESESKLKILFEILGVSRLDGAISKLNELNNDKKYKDLRDWILNTTKTQHLGGAKQRIEASMRLVDRVSDELPDWAYEEPYQWIDLFRNEAEWRTEMRKAQKFISKVLRLYPKDEEIIKKVYEMSENPESFYKKCKHNLKPKEIIKSEDEKRLAYLKAKKIITEICREREIESQTQLFQIRGWADEVNWIGMSDNEIREEIINYLS